MKKIALASAIIFAITLAACKGKKSTESSEQASTEQTDNKDAAANNTPTNEPKSYAVTFSPDTVYLGKNKEAFVRLKDGKAVQLSDADGKITGTELTYEIEVTNKRKLGENSVYINPNDFRLQLDNGNNITHDTYNTISAAAEATNSSTDNKFRLPAGTKPKSLNLFFDETRVTVGVELK
ncbi:hypothetical protein SAMN05428988_2166 [Chitinophaga sp. YR573]|uniref:hypothetical protein n=1 Tax=Chitinophaga sp. YR573 TaxID=1881040 RepID=UPI0008C81069|nr:hypothetical protein [Chitinophaga sp. YR573]SEW11302.1 hypothetical protein SAMN05428988_2166 [Chitinophaga sp. YR573]